MICRRSAATRTRTTSVSLDLLPLRERRFEGGRVDCRSGDEEEFGRGCVAESGGGEESRGLHDRL